MSMESIVDTGYIIYDPQKDEYYTSTTGIFKTERNAQSICDRWNRTSRYEGRLIVRKVNVVFAEQ